MIILDPRSESDAFFAAAARTHEWSGRVSVRALGDSAALGTGPTWRARALGLRAIARQWTVRGELANARHAHGTTVWTTVLLPMDTRRRKRGRNGMNS